MAGQNPYIIAEPNGCSTTSREVSRHFGEVAPRSLGQWTAGLARRFSRVAGMPVSEDSSSIAHLDMQTFPERRQRRFDLIQPGVVPERK